MKKMELKMELENMQKRIELAFDDSTRLQDVETQAAIERIILSLDRGELRVCQKDQVTQKWSTQEWIKKAILLYFRMQKVTKIEAGDLSFQDKIPLKAFHIDSKNRVVPPAVCRRGAYVGANVILMPCFVNIGAYVDEGTMVDTWATVGSCAQIGKNVHLSGGVGIGGVLEPVQAHPVIIEDDVFVGSRCIVVEGVHVESGAVLGAGVTLTASTRIIDVSQASGPKEWVGRIPRNSVVIPGGYLKKFPAGEYLVNGALIIGQRTEGTDKKVSLTAALRDFQVSV